jgi:hypothetical protein
MGNFSNEILEIFQKLFCCCKMRIVFALCWNFRIEFFVNGAESELESSRKYSFNKKAIFYSN